MIVALHSIVTEYHKYLFFVQSIPNRENKIIEFMNKFNETCITNKRYDDLNNRILINFYDKNSKNMKVVEIRNAKREIDSREINLKKLYEILK